MKTFNPVLVPGLILAWLVSSPGNAKEPDLAVDSVLAKWLVGSPGNAKEPLPAVDSVLAKWEEASRKCKTLDAKLTVFRYDGIFGDGRQPTITQGRFYYEAPNLGRYEIRKRKTARVRRTTGRTSRGSLFGPAKRPSGSTEIRSAVRSFPRRNCGQ